MGKMKSTDYKSLKPRRGRATLQGGEGGDRRRRSPRVFDPGFFYALRALVRVVLWLAEGCPGKKEPVHELTKLALWYDAATTCTLQRDPDPGTNRRLQEALAFGETGRDLDRRGGARQDKGRGSSPLEAPPKAAPKEEVE